MTQHQQGRVESLRRKQSFPARDFPQNPWHPAPPRPEKGGLSLWRGRGPGRGPQGWSSRIAPEEWGPARVPKGHLLLGLGAAGVRKAGQSGGSHDRVNPGASG